MAAPDPADLAARLLQARAARGRLELLSEQVAGLGDELAYDVQERLVAALCAHGRDRPVGYKIAMTSPATMALAGASEPAYGVLLRSMVLDSPATLRLGDLYQARIEAEVLFRVDSDLPPGASLAEIVGASRVSAGLELPSARYRDWFGRVRVPDLVADNTATGCVVAGPDAVAAAGIALERIEMRFELDGREIGRGVSAAVLGGPQHAVHWLSQKLALRGRGLPRGTLVSSGTFTLPLPLLPGRYEALFAGVGSVAVTVEG